MSAEKLNQPSSREKAPEVDNKEAQEKLDAIGEKLRNSAEKEQNKERAGEKLEAKQTAEKLAISGKEKAPGSSEKQGQKSVHRNTKKQTYTATMKRVESKLPAYQRTFSRVINNDAVDKVSNVAGRTIARPSGIAGAGIFAFLALGVVSYVANRYGFTTSGSEFIVFIAVGWAAGLLAEGIVKLIKR